MRGHERRHFETFSRAWEQYVSEFRKARSVSVMSLRSERPVSRPGSTWLLRRSCGSRTAAAAPPRWRLSQRYRRDQGLDSKPNKVSPSWPRDDQLGNPPLVTVGVFRSPRPCLGVLLVPLLSIGSESLL